MKLEQKVFDRRVLNVHPRVWGKGAWVYLHTSAFTFPRDEDRSALAERRRAAFRNSLRDLPFVVPCAECRGHLERELAKVDIDTIDTFDGYNSVILWLHNQVRERQQKPPMEPADVLAWLQKEGLDLSDCEACSLAAHGGMRSSSSSSEVSFTRTDAAVTLGVIAVAAACMYAVIRTRNRDRRA